MQNSNHSSALRILVVDDCPDTTASLAVLLKMWGHQFHIARNGPAALTLSQEFQPDVVLLDIGMPGMDGWKLARRLREQDKLGQALMIAMTGYGREEDHRRSREAGLALHLLKPVDPTLLEKLLASSALQADLTPEELERLLTDLGTAADVVEAIDDLMLQLQRGWPLRHWRYALVPWGVRFSHYNRQGSVDAEIMSLSAAGAEPFRRGQVPCPPWMKVVFRD